MQNAQIKINNGIIEQTAFFDLASDAVCALSTFVKTMNPETDDAAVYGINGFIANAKDFLDEEDRYFDDLKSVLKRLPPGDEAVYIIGNPQHQLGFMVASPDDPLGYKDTASAISDLGQMRQSYGTHLKLYRVIPVTRPVITTDDLKQHNADCCVEDFDYSIVEEFIR